MLPTLYRRGSVVQRRELQTVHLPALFLGPRCDSVLASEKGFTHSCGEMHPTPAPCLCPSWISEPEVFSMSPVKPSLTPDTAAMQLGSLGCTGYVCGSRKMVVGPSGLVGTATRGLGLGWGRGLSLAHLRPATFFSACGP